jgi:competence protein ComEC
MPFVRLALALFAGIVWQVWGPGCTFPALFVLLGLTLAYLSLWRIPFFRAYGREWLYGPVALLCLFFAGVTLAQQQKTQTVLPLDRDVWLQAEVCDNPVCTDRYTKVEAIARRYATESDTATVREKIILYLSHNKSQPTPVAGAALYVRTALSLIPPPGNPDEFNYRQYLAREKIFASAFVKGNAYCVDNELSFWKAVQYAPLHWQSRGLEVFADSPIGEREYAVLAALTLGNKQWIDDDLRNTYAAAGAMHILAVSGLHVGIIMVMLGFIMSFLNKRRHGLFVKNILMIVALWIYAAIVGFSPSVTRATVMFSFILIGQNRQWKMSIYNSLAASAFLIACVDPFVIFKGSFQLSYGAVLSIVYFQPRLRGLLYVKNKFLRGIWELATVSFAAQIGTAPVSLLNFHLFPNYFLLTNVCILSLVGFIVYGGVAFLIVHQIPVLSTIAGYVLHAMLWLLNSVVELVEALPGSVTNHIYIDWLQMWLMIAIILFIALYLVRLRRRWLWAAACAATGIIGLYTEQQIACGQQKMVVVYKVKDASYIHFISGRRSVAFCDTAHLQTDFSFNTGNFRVRHRIASGEQRTGTSLTQRDTAIGDVRCYNGFILFENEVYKLLENETIDRRLPPIDVDCLIVTGAARMAPDLALRRYTPKQLIIDSSVAPYRIRRWEEAVAGRDIPWHVVRNEGAFTGYCTRS